MRPATLGALAGSALLSLAAQPAAASSGHRHMHTKHRENHSQAQPSQELTKRGKLVNRSGQCAFPEDAGLVTVTPHELNRGWAMSPDQECVADSFCPYACPPGKLMNQWKPGSTYVYPDSMAGGLYCNKNGEVTKPFPDEDYCVEGIGNVHAVNECGGVVAVCQTVLPGNEAMIIPTSVDHSAIIAVPGTSYWDSTASHFYVNPPGHSTDEACIWGDGTSAIGNWAAYVIGANQDATGDTYVKVGYNPIYTDAFPGRKPSFGLKVECDGTCVGLPCGIDPSTDDFGVVNSALSATGAGGADFCVVTVTSGSARVVFFNTDGSTYGSSPGSSEAPQPKPKPEPAPEPEPEPAPEPAPEPEPKKPAEPTSSKPVKAAEYHAEATTFSPPASSSPASSYTTTHSSTANKAVHITTTSKAPTTVSPTSSRKSKSTLKPSSPKSYTGYDGIFQESNSTANGTSSSNPTTGLTSTGPGDAAAAPAATTTSMSIASKDQAAFAGLVVAIVAAACLY